jgi:hypothetical protein
MANPLKIAPLGWAKVPIVGSDGHATKEFLNWLSKVVAPVQQVVSSDGNIHPEAPVTGRSEGIGTTVQNMTAAGKLASTDAIAADGTGSPLTGGKRAAVALDSNNRLAGSFRGNAVNQACVSNLSSGLSNDGVSTSIFVSSQSFQFGDSAGLGLVSYNSGTADPGVFGTFWIYADDTNFAGGSVNYQFTTTPQTLTANPARVNFGKITTVNGAGKTGGGNTGGTTPGGAGGRGVNLG